MKIHFTQIVFVKFLLFFLRSQNSWVDLSETKSDSIFGGTAVIRKQISILVFGLLLAGSWQASAASLVGDIEVNGFMSTGLAWSDSENIIVNAGITDEPTSDKLTVFGLNFSSKVKNRMSFNAITVIRNREAEPRMRLDTANIAYDLTGSTRIRGGKIRAPVWLISDYYDVKALHPWARAPEEFYEAPLDVFSYDGVSIVQTIPLGGAHVELEAFGGEGEIASREKRIEITGQLRSFVGASARIYGRNWQLKGSWCRGDVKNHTYWDLTPTDDTDAFGDPNKKKSAETINPSPFDTSNMQFTSLGLQYDGMFFLWAEYGRLTSGRTFSPDYPNWNAVVPSIPMSYKELNSFYVTPGYYFFDRDYLVHFTYAHVDDKQYMGIVDGAHHTYTIGLNRYFGDNFVAKASWGQTAPDKYKAGKDGLFNGIVPDQPVNVYDVSLNMTF
jgi:hypothetical protein